MIFLCLYLTVVSLVATSAKNPSLIKQNLIPQTDAFGSEIMANPEINPVSIHPDLSEEPLPDSVYEEKAKPQKDSATAFNITLKPDITEISRSGNLSLNQDEDVKDYPEQTIKEKVQKGYEENKEMKNSEYEANRLGEGTKEMKNSELETTNPNEVNVINEKFDDPTGTSVKVNDSTEEFSLKGEQDFKIVDLKEESMNVINNTDGISDGTSRKLSFGIFLLFPIVLF